LAKANWHFYLIHALKGVAMDICYNELPRPLGRGEEDNRQTALAKFYFFKANYCISFG